MSILATINWDSIFSDGAGLVTIVVFIGGIFGIAIRTIVDRLTSPLRQSIDGLNNSIAILNSTIERNNKDLLALRADVDKIQRDDDNHEYRIKTLERKHEEDEN